MGENLKKEKKIYLSKKDQVSFAMQWPQLQPGTRAIIPKIKYYWALSNRQTWPACWCFLSIHVTKQDILLFAIIWYQYPLVLSIPKSSIVKLGNFI